jgi:membrane-bound serine protease (ClpP class)
MEILLNPNIVYLLLVAGLALMVLALAGPGTGILEFLALVILLIAGYGVANLPINTWALVVLLAGIVLLLLSIFRPGKLVLLLLAIAFLVIGSAFLFEADKWWQPGVDPVLATTVSILMAGFFWIAARKAIEARAMRPAHDLGALVGMQGIAKSDVFKEGSVLVNNELWSARSSQPIHSGASVRVVKRDGIFLEVALAETPAPPAEKQTPL